MSSNRPEGVPRTETKNEIVTHRAIRKVNRDSLANTLYSVRVKVSSATDSEISIGSDLLLYKSFR